jgi:hypothetical protein
MEGGRRKTRRNGMSVKALKRALKKAGLKTTGKKAALTKRAKKARLMHGGTVSGPDKNTGKYTSDKVSGEFNSAEEAQMAEDAELERLAANPTPAPGGRRRRRY